MTAENQSMRREARLDKLALVASEEYRGLLRDIVLLPYRNTRLKRDLRNKLKEYGLPHDLASHSELKRLYTRLSAELNKGEGWEAAIRTKAEWDFRDYLENQSKRKAWSSVWIGNCNIDLYYPTVRVGKCVGLAIEVDGLIHDKEPKHQKDNFKDEFLASLNIYVKHIENADIDHSVVKRDLMELLTSPAFRANSRSVKNMWRKVYIETLSRYPEFTFRELGLGRGQVEELLDIVRKHRGRRSMMERAKTAVGWRGVR